MSSTTPGFTWWFLKICLTSFDMLEILLDLIIARGADSFGVRQKSHRCLMVKKEEGASLLAALAATIAAALASMS